MSRILTLQQILRHVPKKHLNKINTELFDVDTGYDRPLYFIFLKDQYEVVPDQCGTITFFTIDELKDNLDRIREVQA